MQKLKLSEIEKGLAKEAGLVESGQDEDGNQEYIGTNAQWNRFERLKEHYSEVQFDERDKEYPNK